MTAAQKPKTVDDTTSSPMTTMQLMELESDLLGKDGLDEVAAFLKELGLDAGLVEFLAGRGENPTYGERKLREALEDYIAFDLKYGTDTTRFFSETVLQTLSLQNPELFADPRQAEHTVRHRPSRTDSVESGLNNAASILRSYGINPDQALLTDLGCGTGKVLCMAMSHTGDFASPLSNPGSASFPFKRAVGVDLFKTVAEIAIENLKSEALKIGITSQEDHFENGEDRVTLDMEDGRSVSLVFSDAATYTEYNGVNVIFMYNPFDEEVMEQVERNLRRYGGKALVIYNKPKHEGIFTDNGWQEEYRESNIDPDKQLVILSHGFPGPSVQIVRQYEEKTGSLPLPPGKSSQESAPAM